MQSIEAALPQEKAFDLRQLPAWLWFAGFTYAILMMFGSKLLNDPDTYWQLATGRWILDHGAFPHTDIYSFTKFGAPWISSSWLAQVLYAACYGIAGWAGVVSLAAIAVSLTFVQFICILSRRIAATYAVMAACAVLIISLSHFLARPHVLVLPIMLAWANGLLSASERGEAPSLRLLPLIALWANLHGSFVFGLVLAGAFALDALWNVAGPVRRQLALRWLVFGMGACAACCVTPYGWEGFLSAYKILDLGELLRLIPEWMSTDFSSLSPFELAILALIAGALHLKIRLSLARIALVLGLTHMALSHVRSHEILALLLPLVLLTPVTAQLGIEAPSRAIRGTAAATIVAAAMLAAEFGLWTLLPAAQARIQPPEYHSPVAAVDILTARGAKRILNGTIFSGYLIWRDIPVFVDGRAELYGEKFVMDYYNAISLQDVNALLRLLRDYQIDAVLMEPQTPAALMLDHLGGWQRIYADKNAVVHVRAGT